MENVNRNLAADLMRSTDKLVLSSLVSSLVMLASIGKQSDRIYNAVVDRIIGQPIGILEDLNSTVEKLGGKKDDRYHTWMKGVTRETNRRGLKIRRTNQDGVYTSFMIYQPSQTEVELDKLKGTLAKERKAEKTTQAETALRDNADATGNAVVTPVDPVEHALSVLHDLTKQELNQVLTDVFKGQGNYKVGRAIGNVTTASS